MSFPLVLSANTSFSAISWEKWKEVYQNHFVYSHISSKRLPTLFLQIAKNIQQNNQWRILYFFLMCNVDIYSFLAIFFKIPPCITGFHKNIREQCWWYFKGHVRGRLQFTSNSKKLQVSVTQLPLPVQSLNQVSLSALKQCSPQVYCF